VRRDIWIAAASPDSPLDALPCLLPAKPVPEGLLSPLRDAGLTFRRTYPPAWRTLPFRCYSMPCINAAVSLASEEHFRSALMPLAQSLPEFLERTTPTTLAVGAAGAVAALWLAGKTFSGGQKSQGRFPPGPPGKPLVGNLFDMPTEKEWLAYAKLAEQYGAYS